MNSVFGPAAVYPSTITLSNLIGTVSREPRYTVCVRYNGRDVNRQYMGSTDRIGIFYGGRLNQLIEPAKDQCARAPYKPFPELEKLCLAKKCD